MYQIMFHFLPTDIGSFLKDCRQSTSEKKLSKTRQGTEDKPGRNQGTEDKPGRNQVTEDKPGHNQGTADWRPIVMLATHTVYPRIELTKETT